MTLKLASLSEARERRPLGEAWYNPKDHTIYIGFVPPRYLLEVLSHEALHQTLRDMFGLSNFADRASRGIDIIISAHGNILRRGGL